MGFRAHVRAIAAGKEPPAPFDQILGARLIDLRDGAATMEMDANERLHNPTQVLHGGALAGLADSTMAYAVSSVLSANETATSIDVTIRFLRPTVRGRLVASGHVLKAGRTLLTTQCEITNAERELVALATSNWVRLAAKKGSAWRSAPAKAPRR